MDNIRTVQLSSWTDVAPLGAVGITSGERESFEPHDDEAIAWIVDHAEAIRLAVLRETFAQYPQWQRDYGYEGDEARDLMPDVATTEEIVRLLSNASIHLHGVLREGRPYFGVQLSCTWDREHALGAMMHGERVVEVGGADTALLAWIADADA